MNNKEKLKAEKAALVELLKSKELTTNLLEPLGISFEYFLRFAQMSEHSQRQVLTKFIAGMAYKHFACNPFITYGWSTTAHNRRRPTYR